MHAHVYKFIRLAANGDILYTHNCSPCAHTHVVIRDGETRGLKQGRQYGAKFMKVTHKQRSEIIARYGVLRAPYSAADIADTVRRELAPTHLLYLRQIRLDPRTSKIGQHQPDVPPSL